MPCTMPFSWPLPLLLCWGSSTSPLPFPATVFGCDYGILATIVISVGGSKDDQLLYADDAAPAFVEAFFDVGNAKTDTR